MQTVVIIPEPEWRQVLSRLEKLEQAEQERHTPPTPPDKVLGTRAAARYIGLCEEVLLRARRSGRIQEIGRAHV